jgi:hypothetical protein
MRAAHDAPWTPLGPLGASGIQGAWGRLYRTFLKFDNDGLPLYDATKQ